MSTSDLQLKLHQIIDQVNDPEILNAVHTLLINKIERDELLELSETDIQNGRTISLENLKNEIKTWRKK